MTHLLLIVSQSNCLIQVVESPDETVKCTDWCGPLLIAPDNMLFFFQPKSIDIFLFFSMKMYVVNTHQKCLAEMLLISIHNIHFPGEIRKNIYLIIGIYPPLSRLLFTIPVWLCATPQFKVTVLKFSILLIFSFFCVNDFF